MNKKETEKLLEGYELELECFLPLEISHKVDNSRANGICAQYIIYCCKRMEEDNIPDREPGIVG